MSRGKGHAIVQCASCGLKQEIETAPADQMVDVYCRFTDKFYGTTHPTTLSQAQAPPGGAVPSETQQVQDEERPAEVQLSSEAASGSAEQQSEPESSEQASEGFELDLNKESEIDEEGF